MSKCIFIFIILISVFCYGDNIEHSWNVVYEPGKECGSCGNNNNLEFKVDQLWNKQSYQMKLNGWSYKESEVSIYLYESKAIIFMDRKTEERVVIYDLENKSLVIDFIGTKTVISPSRKYIAYMNFRPNRPTEEVADTLFIYDVSKKVNLNIEKHLWGLSLEDLMRSYNKYIGLIIFPKENSETGKESNDLLNKYYINNLNFLDNDTLYFDYVKQSPKGTKTWNIAVFNMAEKIEESIMYLHCVTKEDVFKNPKNKNIASISIDKVKIIEKNIIEVKQWLDHSGEREVENNEKNETFKVDFNLTPEGSYFPLKKITSSNVNVKREFKLIIKEDKYDFGVVKKGKIITHIFLVKNNDTKPIKIDRIDSSKYASGAMDNDIIAPGKEIEIGVGVNTEYLEGEIHEYVKMYSEEVNAHIITLEMSGKVTK